MCADVAARAALSPMSLRLVPARRSEDADEVMGGYQGKRSDDADEVMGGYQGKRSDDADEALGNYQD